ncbi:MAG TPA: putative peptidoglycan glycosyltransferase FtsW [Hyphomicrobiaceae bacterium]|jgi:cell division protein FtsW
MTLSRAERSVLTDWWFTVDRMLLAAILAIAGAGVVLSLAASPAIAIRRGLPTYYFVERQLVFIAAGVALMLALSLLSPASVRRLALAVFAVCLVLMVAVLVGGTEINGARRWLHFGTHSLQPSEFAKPAFVVLSAWLLAERRRRPDMPALPVAFTLYLVFAGLLALQPDVGQALLVSLVGCALFFLAGGRVAWAFAFLAMLSSAFTMAYYTAGYVRLRVDRFLSPGAGESYQAGRARQSFIEGGLFGRGPGEGTIKSVLPDAHNDFIYAVIAEEYGVLICIVLLGMFALVVVRVFARQMREGEDFLRLGATGLALLFGLQALINMAVNTGLLPTKGMTLPFISIGGSSTLAVSLGLGMLLALGRRRPSHAKKPALVPMPARSGTV